MEWVAVILIKLLIVEWCVSRIGSAVRYGTRMNATNLEFAVSVVVFAVMAAFLVAVIMAPDELAGPAFDALCGRGKD